MRHENSLKLRPNSPAPKRSLTVGQRKLVGLCHSPPGRACCLSRTCPLSPPPFSILLLSLASSLTFDLPPILPYINPTSIYRFYHLQPSFTVTSDRISPRTVFSLPPITSFCLICVAQSTRSIRVRILRPTVLSPPSIGLDRHPSLYPIYPLPTVGNCPRITRLSHLCHFLSSCVVLTRSYVANKRSLYPCPVVPG